MIPVAMKPVIDGNPTLVNSPATPRACEILFVSARGALCVCTRSDAALVVKLTLLSTPSQKTSYSIMPCTRKLCDLMSFVNNKIKDK